MTDEPQGKASELMKKVLTVGVGAIFLTEESLRNLVSEFKLPKEMLKPVLDSAGKMKNDFLKTLSKEVMSHIAERVNFEELTTQILRNNEIELQVKVNFEPKKKVKKS